MIVSTTDSEAITLAVAALDRGQLVVVPTDTVYGLMCSPYKPAAVERIYELKQRPPDKALQVLLADTSNLLGVARDVSPLAYKLALRFWPGALSMTLPKRPGLAPNLSVYDTIAVRVPDHNFCRQLLRAVGGALAASSANISNGPNPTDVQAAVEHFGEEVALYIDGGPTSGSTPSTVVDLHEDGLTVLREGAVTQAMLDEVSG